MKTDYRILAIILTFALLFVCVSCTKPDPGSDPSVTEPTVTDEPAATDEPTATDEPSATDKPTATDEPAPVVPAAVRTEPGICGHYVLLDGGALYDLNTGAFCASGVRLFIPARNSGIVSLAVTENGALVGWYEAEPDEDIGLLMGRANGTAPVELFESGIVKAEPGCALTEDGRVLVWGGEYAPGGWDELTAEQRIKYVQPREVINAGAVDIADSLALIADGTLVNIYTIAAGLAASNPATVDTDVVKLYPDWVYVKSDNTVHINTWTGENAAEVFEAPSQPGWVYYIDSEGRLCGTLDSNSHVIMENVDRIVFDRVASESIEFSYLLALTKDGGLWWADDYYGNNEPYLITENAVNAWSDGMNIYVLKDDGALYAYTAWHGFYTDRLIGARPEGKYALVKVLDGVASCGVVMELGFADEEGEAHIYSTFCAVTEDGRIFSWGHINGETVSEPAEIFLMRTDVRMK